MSFIQKPLLLLFRISSRLILGSGSNAEWIFEKVQRPENVFALARNMACYYLQLKSPPRIITLMVEPAFGCNLRCRYCFCWGESAPDIKGNRPHLMSKELFQKAIDQVPRSVECITFAGMGEPLLNPQLSEMIDYCDSKGFRTVVITNGTLLKGETLERLAASRLTALTVSVEADAEQSDYYRGIEVETVYANVENFITAKRPETEVKLSVVAHKENAEFQFEALARKLPLVDYVKVNPAMGYGGIEPNLICMEPWRGNLTVLTDGRVTLCCLDSIPEFDIGNLNEESFCDILRGETYRKMIECMVGGEMPGRCVECTEFSHPGVPRKAPKRKFRK